MERTRKLADDTAPLNQPGVEAAVDTLADQLAQLLGTSTEYVLVIARVTADQVQVQAATNVSPPAADRLMAAAMGVGFDSMN